jgi:WD40 repeat protein
MRVSYKGDLIATVGDEGVVKVFNIFSEYEKSKLMNVSYDQIFTCVDMSSMDPDAIVTGDTTKKIISWSLSQGRVKQTLNFHKDRVNAVRFMSSDRNKVVSGANDMSMKLSDLAKGNVIKTYAPGSSPLAIANDYALIYSVHSDGSLKIWSENKGFPIHNEADYHYGRITCLQQSNDSNYLATSDMEGVIQVFDLRMQKRLHRIPSGGYHNSFDRNQVTFSTDDSKIIAGSSEGNIFVWDITAKPVLIGKHETKIGCAIHSVGLSPITNSLFATTQEGHVICIDLNIC